MKTKNEIIDIIASSYTSSTIAIENGGCVYKTSNGLKCAVGMFMTEEGIKEFASSKKSALGIHYELRHNERCLDNILIEDVRGHEAEFWRELQKYLHDVPHNWDSKGLTPDGVRAVTELKEYWS